MLSEIAGLESYWARKSRRSPPAGAAEHCARQWMADRILLDMLGIGIEQAHGFLGRGAPNFAAFMQWILATAGPPEQERVDRYHAWLAGESPPPNTARRLRTIDAAPPVLNDDDLAHWAEQGYVILRAAISAEEAAAAADALWRQLRAAPDDPESWYAADLQGIMVQLFQHDALEPARRSPRVHKAFAQLWGSADLWATTDRMGFNPPERRGHPYAGDRLHWDVSLVTPIPFATQAILYLTDTGADQGALTLVPGFHRRIEAWLANLPSGADPRRQDLSGEARPVAAAAGDLIIWRQDLPHGASPNRSSRPRLVQYVNMYSPARERRPGWR
jgi:hypothetical protein